ncbi:hypothetical protein C6497_12090 [Candidatus Poribacteria bacterium]|nr:MAG: hypothetical protein C6497_12090 [Candidatus Poribacteria bacterium]
MFCILSMITGCSTIFTAQEWSENYALMDGAQSTSPEMIDGNLETIGEASLTSEHRVYTLNDRAEFVRNDSIVVVSLPAKKNIYRIILHTVNLKEFVVYIDKSKVTKGENWHRVTEMQDVRSSIIDLKFKMPYYTNQVKIRIVKTNPQNRAHYRSMRLSSLVGSGNLNRSIYNGFNTRTHQPGRIREIEIYGIKAIEK